MKISSTKIRNAGVFILIGVLFGVAIGLGLSNYNRNEKQPVTFYYADNYSGELNGIINSKKVYTIIDENGNHYVVPEDTYNNVNKGYKLDSITK